MQLLSPGSILFDRFRVAELVNGSGQSFGYRAFDSAAPSTSPWLQSVFLKQYHDLVPGSGEAFNLTRHFSALRKRLGEKANYICLPIHLGEAANSVVAAYPWVAGSTLQNHMEQGLSQGESVRLVMALTNTVRLLHKQGIAHLDLKPSNVVVKKRPKDGKLYLQVIDLDAAQIDGEGLRREIIGSQDYMSPEHYYPRRFGSVSTKSDVFTLGIMLFELLLDEHPFRAASDYATAIAEEAYDVPENDLHLDVVGVLVKCLHADPRLRPQAGWVQKILTENYDNFFKARHDGERWIPPGEVETFVQLEGQGSATGFRRTYYETVDMDRNELRGARAGTAAGGLFRLARDGSGWCVTLLDDSVEVELQGKPLRRGQRAELSSLQELKIGCVSFLVTVGRFRAT